MRMPRFLIPQSSTKPTEAPITAERSARNLRKHVRTVLLLPMMVLLIGTPLLAQECLLPLYRTKSQAATNRIKGVDERVLTLPFFDDFSNYEGQPSLLRWAESDAFVNRDFATLPPTVGMATLDALRADGTLHANASTALFGADTLASLPLRLDSLFSPVTKRLTPADSVYLSFYYLPGGGAGVPWQRTGDAPDEQDSLLVEFYDEADSLWIGVWGTAGVSEDSLTARTGTRWQQVLIPITDGRFFQHGFRFRFRNICSLSSNALRGEVGNSDQWNIDYVRLDRGRTRNDRYSRDVAFVERAPSMLRRYTAMPARQFTPSDMRPTIPMTITNLYSQALPAAYAYTVTATSDGNILHQYNGGNDNVPSFPATGSYQTAPMHATPSVGFSFTPTWPSTSYEVRHVVSVGGAGDIHTENDTLVQTCTFADYYAYDDGVPENGYGVKNSGPCSIAMSFALNHPDTLMDVYLYINSTREQENTGIQFRIGVWANVGGRPGAQLYADETLYRVVDTALNHYVRYPLSRPLAVRDSVFIGIIQQTSLAYMNLGFDRSNDASRYTYTSIAANTWAQSYLKGAVMIRPCFGSGNRLGINDEPLPAWSVYPNPATDHITLHTSEPLPAGTQAIWFDLKGHIVHTVPAQQTLDVSQLPVGIYLLRLAMPDRKALNQRIIIGH